jgi:hypothetical protein
VAPLAAKVVVVFFAMFIIRLGLDTVASENCMGYDCETLYCPDNYAIKTPTGYVPCEEIESE